MDDSTLFLGANISASPIGPQAAAGDEEEHNVSLRSFIAIAEHHAPYAIFINKYVTPIWYVIGLTGNVISAFFWSSQRIRTCNTAAVYLTSLAVADFSYLALHIFYELEHPWLIHTLNVHGWCQLWNVLYMAATYFCVLLVCAFTCERFLSVCHPFKSERFGRTRSPRIILVLLLASIILGSPQAYFWQVTLGECKVRESEVVPESFYTIWNWCTDMLIFGALPALVLVLNICVLRKIRSAGRLRLSDSPVSHHNFTATTVTLLWVSFYLIFTTLPVTIVYAIQTAIPLGRPMPLEDMGKDPAWQTYISYYAARVIIREIGMSHHVGNVFIYLATSRRFRRQLSKLCSRRGWASTGDGHTETTNFHSMHPLQSRKISWAQVFRAQMWFRPRGGTYAEKLRLFVQIVSAADCRTLPALHAMDMYTKPQSPVQFSLRR
ncbi:lysophosphatidic acid receptor 6-like [Littorina saxatilis]|uniref:lysophosphatidic acid receptor 6-like n=1 Tax=Littorina saxatilis TaxID=31220 RepID=UPI0038B43647